MAEGDTVHRNAARIEAALGAGPLVEASAPNPRSPLRLQSERLGSLAGRRLVRADAHGKHLFLRFEGDLTLHCHQGARGSWRVYERGARGRRRLADAWLAMSSATATVAEFGGSRLRLLTEAELRADPRLRALGPDVLEAAFTVERGLAALRATGQSRELGEVLLDQSVIAGVGNVYKAEACFAARIDPWRRLEALRDDELRCVIVEVASLMRAGLETGARPHDVYRRAGRPCLRCGEPVRSREQGDANRTTYWCARCQT
jgi:endonuclease VIII